MTLLMFAAVRYTFLFLVKVISVIQVKKIIKCEILRIVMDAYMWTLKPIIFIGTYDKRR